MALRSRPGRVFLWLAVILSLLLTACPRPLTHPTTPSGNHQAFDPLQVEGRVDFGPKVQATLADDIAPGATVSLIEVDTGNTVSSTRTDTAGKFVLRFSNGFKPRTGVLYYFEAVKGLKAGTTQPNAVGADAVRLRTITKFESGGWLTLTNAIPGSSVIVSRMTTALSTVVSLRSTTNRPVDANTLMGAILSDLASGGYPDTLNLPDTNLVPITMVQRAYDLVQDSLDKDRDALYWIALSTADPLHNTVILPDAPFTIAYLSPDSAAPLETIDLVGTNFGGPGENKVFFQADGGTTVEGTVKAVSPDLSRITVEVPAPAVNGPVVLNVNDKVLNGPPFRPAIRDGHSVVDLAGNVYVVNQAIGTVAIVEKLAGTNKTGVRSVISGLDNPTALTFGPSNFTDLFVACGGASPTVWKVNLTDGTKVAYSGAGSPANASGIAFRVSTGALYLSDSVANKLYVISTEGAAVQEVVVTGQALNQPKGLSFGTDGRLYVANSGANNVLAVDLSTNDATEFVGGLSTPWGLAFDNRGNFYVSNFKGNFVYRMPVTSSPGVTPITYGAISSFASIPTPAGLDADASGYIYVADRVSNGIYRINSLAQRRQIGFGISYPTSLWVDDTGKYILTDTGNLLRIDTAGTLSVYADGLVSCMGLVKDSLGNFYTLQKGSKAITQIKPDGSTYVVLTGLSNEDNSELQIYNDKLYLRSRVSPKGDGTNYPTQGEVLEFDVNNLGAGPNRKRTLLRRATAIARDESGGTYSGKYYVLNGNEGSIVRVDRLASNRSQVTPFLTDTARLKNPQDLWVDGTGRVWVADHDGTGGTGGLFVYNPDGTLAADYSASVSKPTNLCFDGVNLYVNSYVSAGDIRQISTTDGTVVRTIGGFSYPRGFGFTDDRSIMYVNEWGLDRISKVANYQTSTTIEAFYSSGDRTDVEVVGTNLYFTYGSDLRKLAADGITLDPYFRRHYNTLLRTFKQNDGKLVYVTDYGWIHHQDYGNYTSFSASLHPWSGRNEYGITTGSGIVTNTALVTYTRAGPWTQVSEQAVDGSLMKTYYYGSDFGGMATNGTDEFYFTRTIYGHVIKLHNGSFTTLSTPVYASTDRSYGIAYYNGKLYQSIYTLHKIDEIDAALGGRTSLLIGLVAPEI